MLALTPIYVLWIFWAAVTASPILVQNTRTSSMLEQRIPPQWELFLGKQNVGTPRERWGIFFARWGTVFAAKTQDTIPDEEPKMELVKIGRRGSWTLIDLNAKVRYNPAFPSSKKELYGWIEHDMVSSLRQSTTRPDWWPQGTPFDSSPQPMRVIYYGGPEPDVNNPQAPNKRKRTGGSSLDMVWVILEELGKRKLYLGDNQGVPEIFQDEFNKNYINIWRRRWQTTAHGEKAVKWMLKQYPQSRFPEWAKLWSEAL
ncbi:hypothetical protein D9757_003886 [Collybiopsis confluens]|uniref:Uncharacterized protein n=1 Tax=Collybiopsis confluens TaxID=2823264 RepID=A0A8H5HUX8_9AGAR|nr:hypothetical protein D9757_003886 [Collybiopsis confluens]